MSDLKIIEPIEIIQGRFNGTPTPETDYSEWAVGTTYASGDRIIVKFGHPILEAEGLDYKNFHSVCVAADGDVYATVYGEDIYKKAFNGDSFYGLGQTARNWTGICEDPVTGNVYAATYGGDIYMQTAGSGNFAALSQTSRNWMGMAATTTGNIYCVVYGGDIYKRTSGAGNFTGLGDTSRNWWGLCADTGDELYATVYGGDIYKYTGEAGSFTSMSATSRNWRGICYCNDIGANLMVADTAFYQQQGLVGDPVVKAYSPTPTTAWYGLGCGTLQTVYACSYGQDIFSWPVGVHRIYESVADSNTGNYPPYDITLTTPKWIEIGATNMFKPFDGKSSSQAVGAASAGIGWNFIMRRTFNSVALLNLEATSVLIGFTGGYSNTITLSGKTDCVDFSVPGTATGTLSIVVFNSAGAVKVGEILIGNAFTIGTLRPAPTVGITDYSSKTQDEFGDWTIVERNYSEKMSCAVNITYSSVDSVIATLKNYRATPVVWVGSTDYSCLILYGFLKDWSVPVSTRGKSIMNIEVEGLT